MKRLLLALVLLFGLTGCDGAGFGDGVNLGPAVFGVAYDSASNAPLAGVRVEIGNFNATSTQTGNYYVGQLSRGTHTLKATKDGYATLEMDVVVNDSMVEKKLYLSKQ